MLVINRQVGETVRVDDTTYITVLGFSEYNGKSFVKIGFDAPRSVSIYREELYRKHNQELEFTS